MTDGVRPHRFRALAEDNGVRLDQVLAARVPDLSRTRARVLIDIGGVFVDGARTKVAGRKVRAGQTIVAHLGGALRRATNDVGAAARARDEADLPPFAIVYEDDDVLVADKPALLLTAPTPESDRQNLLHLLGQTRQVHLVHRLDLPTSGLLVFAKTQHASNVLAEKMRVHDVERAYLAVVRGAFPEGDVTASAPLRGKHAVTHFARIETLGDRASWVRCRLETGRTHQIRMHAQGLGHAVLGDRRYGEPTAFDPPRLALHATVLGFEHPRTKAPLRFESPWPADLEGWLAGLRDSTKA